MEPPAQPPAKERFHRIFVDFPYLLSDIADKYFEDFQIVFKRSGNMAVNFNWNNHDELITRFIRISHPSWKLAHGKEWRFFPLAAEIFCQLEMKYYQIFKQLYDHHEEIINKKLLAGSNDSDDDDDIELEDLEAIWKYIHAFIKISINYIHEQRGPCIREYFLGEDNSPSGSSGTEGYAPLQRPEAGGRIPLSNAVKKQIPAYRFSFLPEIDLNATVQLWKIDRIFEEDTLPSFLLGNPVGESGKGLGWSRRSEGPIQAATISKKK
jgi:hypothetical protein